LVTNPPKLFAPLFALMFVALGHVVCYVHNEDEHLAIVLRVIPQEVGTKLLFDITKESSGLPIESIDILGLGVVWVFDAL
jgi:hypothetical protein